MLECFTDEEPVLGVAELSRRVALSTSIVFRVVLSSRGSRGSPPPGP